MKIDFKDKIVLVTGGTRGIGRAIVERFAEAGATVVFTYASSDATAHALTGLLRERGHNVLARRVDVKDETAVTDLFGMIESELGRLDVLVNNAGIVRDGLLLAMETSDWAEVLHTNLNGVFYCTRAAAALMMRRRQGSIVNLSSVAATRPGRGHCNYVAAKGGLEAMTKALAIELASRNIRVNCVAPGIIETDMSQDIRNAAGDELLARIPLKRFGRPDEIANAVLFIASEQASYITGTTLHIDGGVSA